ncbi:uncharacterized protein METZ01_LOCUS108845 [marine metagenome]|uniref:Uncharacterized protein n=1 Tax=marine metagenome TaxID=408172 RepID=A0A381WUN5_9ZZZZ
MKGFNKKKQGYGKGQKTHKNQGPKQGKQRPLNKGLSGQK